MIVTIKENHLFEKCYRKGKRWCGKYTAVYVLPDYRSEKYRRMMPDKKKVNRIGLTVTKRVGGAVVRTRVRRILREAVRLIYKDAGETERRDLKTGFLVVIAARDAAAKAKTTDIIPELKKAHEKLGLLRIQKTESSESETAVKKKESGESK
ncbi:MAG: ribonuclease P protein component [Clostridia bacterium]|nr:ribonuclease P protein component [Clostridia bacterium]